MLVSDVLKAAYRKLGRPAQVELPYEDLIAVTRDVWRGLTLDLKMAARGHTTEMGSWVVPTAREMSAASFTGGGYIIPVQIEWRPADSDDPTLAHPVDIIALEQINQVVPHTNRPVVAFYDDFSTIVFGDFTELLYNREYRVAYESLSDIDLDETDDLIHTPDLFISYLADEVAIRALDHIDGNEAWAEKRERLRSGLMASLVENKMRFERWRTTQFGNKKIRKTPRMIRRGY